MPTPIPSASNSCAREKLASSRVNAYLDKLMVQQAGFVQVPPPLEQSLRQKYGVTINQTAMDKAVTTSTKLKVTADSLRAKNAPPSEVPLGGTKMPQGAPAQSATPAPAPAAAPVPPAAKPHN